MNMNANTAPTLGTYTNHSIAVGGSAAISPNAVPDDNGSVDAINATIAPLSYTGIVSANIVSGEVNTGIAAPIGIYTVTVTVDDNCGTSFQREFSLEVVGDDVFTNGFE